MKRYLVLLLSISCAQGDIDCEIDTTFSQEQRSEIVRAADTWNGIASRGVRIVDDGEWLIVSSPSPRGLGYAQSNRRLIRISPSTPNDQVYAVALHELGHALGLHHVTRGVMDPDHQTIDFSAEDLAECRHAGACH